MILVNVFFCLIQKLIKNCLIYIISQNISFPNKLNSIIKFKSRRDSIYLRFQKIDEVFEIK